MRPCVPDPLDLRTQRAVALAGDVRDVLEELALGDAAGEVALREVVVVAPRPPLRRRCRRVVAETASSSSGTRGQQRPDQRPLAGARGPGDHEHRRRRARLPRCDASEPSEASGASLLYRLKSPISSVRCRSERPPTVFDSLIRHWFR